MLHTVSNCQSLCALYHTNVFTLLKEKTYVTLGLQEITRYALTYYCLDIYPLPPIYLAFGQNTSNSIS